MELLNSDELSTTFNNEELITFYEKHKKYFYDKINNDKDANYKIIKSYGKKQDTSFQLDLAPISSKNLELIYKTKYYNRPLFQKEGRGNTIGRLYELFSRVINLSPIYYKTDKNIFMYPSDVILSNTYREMDTILQNITNFLSYFDKAYSTNLLEIYKQLEPNINPDFNFNSNSTNENINPNFNKIDFNENEKMNENIIQILYKIGLINIENYDINHALTYLVDKNISVKNDIVYYFDVEKNKLIKINNLILTHPGNIDKDIDPSTYCIGKHIEIIDINYDEDNYAYNFIYIDKKYDLTNLKSINKSIHKIKMNRERGHEGVVVDYLDDDYYNKELDFYDFIKGEERTLKTKLERILPRSLTGTSNEFYNPYFTKYKDERFKIAMNSMSPFILNVLLNNKPFSKYINKSKVFNSAQPNLINNLDPNHILNYTNLKYSFKYSFDTDLDFNNFNMYNTQFTIDISEHKSTNTKSNYRRNSTTGVGSMGNNSDILYNNLLDFFESNYKIFIGFIYLPNNHENLCIIDKERNILIKYDPKGNSYNPLNLKNYFKYLLTDLVSIRNSRDVVIINFLKGLPDMNYIDTSKIDSIYGFDFPQTGIKSDTNSQTYILCSALLYCMNLTFPNDKTIKMLKLTKTDSESHYNKILLLTEYGIRKEHAKYFRKKLYTSILPLISNKDITKFNIKDINYNEYYDMPKNLGFLKAVMDHQKNRFDELKFILNNNKNIKVIIAGDKATGKHNLGTGYAVDDWKHTYSIDITKTGIENIQMYSHLNKLISILIDLFPGRIEIGPIGRKGLKTVKSRHSMKKYTNYCRENIDVDDSPSQKVIHVWGANEANWNLDNFYENKKKTWDTISPTEKDIYKINGTGQVDCLLYQSLGVFGIVTTLKEPKNISMLFYDTTNKILDYIENSDNNNNRGNNKPRAKNTRVNNNPRVNNKPHDKNTSSVNNNPRDKNTPSVNPTPGKNAPGKNAPVNPTPGKNASVNPTRGKHNRNNKTKKGPIILRPLLRNGKYTL